VAEVLFALIEIVVIIVHYYKTRTIKNIQNAVNECFQDYEVHLYGSHATNLCLPWSDLDVVLISKKNNQISLDSKHLLLSKLNEYLKHQPW